MQLGELVLPGGCALGGCCEGAAELSDLVDVSGAKLSDAVVVSGRCSHGCLERGAKLGDLVVLCAEQGLRALVLCLLASAV